MLRRCVAKRLASSRPVFFPSCFRLRDGESRSALNKAGDQKPLDAAQQQASPFGGG